MIIPPLDELLLIRVLTYTYASGVDTGHFQIFSTLKNTIEHRLFQHDLSNFVYVAVIIDATIKIRCGADSDVTSDARLFLTRA